MCIRDRWGVVDVANTNSHDAARVSCVTPSFTLASGSWDKVRATAQLLADLRAYVDSLSLIHI